MHTLDTKRRKWNRPHMPNQIDIYTESIIIIHHMRERVNEWDVSAWMHHMCVIYALFVRTCVIHIWNSSVQRRSETKWNKIADSSTSWKSCSRFSLFFIYFLRKTKNNGTPKARKFMQIDKRVNLAISLFFFHQPCRNKASRTQRQRRKICEVRRDAGDGFISVFP